MSGFASLSRKVVRIPLRAIPRGTVLPVLSGPLRGARWVVGAGTHGCWLGTYEPQTRHWLQAVLGPGKVFFDIGANVGFFTLLGSRIVGEAGAVVAFEPLPENLGALKVHVRLNGARNVNVVAAAVSDRAGRERFGPVDNPAMGGRAPEGSIEVVTVALDDLVREGAVRRPDVLKIDVEGAELRVLAGARRTLEEARPAIVLSAHGWQLFDTCRDLLRQVGYEVHLAKDGPDDGDYLLVARSAER